ncbi:glycosyltransferase family 2 protein [Mycetohabitans endofungorum]|uniref:glycosyltransferase n=1 Tax=Mycetohabitans endofungorum TaxID=417203 RepID=UPI0030CC4978
MNEIFAVLEKIFGLLIFIILIPYIAALSGTIVWLIANRGRSKNLWCSIKSENNTDCPFVSVIVPAFNEEKVIAATVQSLLKNDYPHMEIIVVDDGSKDCTRAIVTDISIADPRIRILTSKYNKGKANALNMGVAAAGADYIVVVDADTIVTSNFIRKITEPIINGKADAVAANVKVGNRRKIKSIFQSIEYNFSLGITKSIQSGCNCITTLPGAGSAFVKNYIFEAGGFTATTCAEDTELTLRLAEHGFQMMYQSSAIVYTEAPATWISLFRQRRRWIYGNMQCVQTHIHNMRLESMSSFLGMPFFVYFNFIKIPTEFLVVVSFFYFLVNDCNIIVVYGYLTYMFLMWVAAGIIYHQGQERKMELIYLPLTIFVWPLFLFIPYTSALFNLIHQRRPNWCKLERSAEVANSLHVLSAKNENH